MAKRMIIAGVAAGLAVMLGASAAVAQQATGGVINVGEAFGAFGPYVNSAVGALITVGMTLLFFYLRTKFNIDTDGSFRAAMEAFLKNQASALIAKGEVRFSGTKVEVSSIALASAANLALTLIPETMKRFNLTPEVIAQKIIAAIPQNETAAAVIASQVTPPAAVILDTGSK